MCMYICVVRVIASFFTTALQQNCPRCAQIIEGEKEQIMHRRSTLPSHYCLPGKEADLNYMLQVFIVPQQQLFSTLLCW
jgi:hypothetical protein